MSVSAERRATAQQVLLVFAAWTFLAVFSAAQGAVYMTSRGLPINWSERLPGVFADWYTCALFTPLKPFDRARFEKTLARFETQWKGARQSGVGQTGISEDLKKFLSELAARNGETYTSRFAVKSNAGIYFVRADDIEWIDAAGNYAELHAGGKKHLIRETIKSVEAKLDPKKFIRVHRSAIINLDKLRKLQPYFHGEYVVTMQDGTTLTSSRGYSDRLRALLQ